MGSAIIELVKREDVIFFAGLFDALDSELLALLRAAKIPNDLYSSEHDYRYLPEVTVKNLIRLLGEQTCLAEFTLLITSACKHVYIPKFISKLTQQTSLKAALDEFALILTEHSTDAKVYTQYAGEKWWFVREKRGQQESWFQYAELFSVVFMSQLISELTRGAWQPEEVGVQADSVAEFNQLPGFSQVQFYAARPVTALFIPTNVMLSAISLPTQFTHPANATEPAIKSSSFVESFKYAIKPYTSTGKLPIKLAAEILNMNIRTLQRQLAKEGAVYSELIESMVLEQCLDLLKCQSIHITRIASKMGYSDAAHFTRAFKRQMQMTPTQYRRSCR